MPKTDPGEIQTYDTSKFLSLKVYPTVEPFESDPFPTLGVFSLDRKPNFWNCLYPAITLIVMQYKETHTLNDTRPKEDNAVTHNPCDKDTN